MHSNFIYPLVWDLISWGEHEVQVVWDLKSHFIAVLVQQKYWGFLSIFVYFSYKNIFQLSEQS